MTMWIALQRVTAAALLLPFGPVIGVLAVLIRLDSPGPILYRARRVGLGGVAITVHKFRSMRWEPDRVGPPVTFRDDPRITRIGRFLRDTRLDELPQLWDVARGVMALVGPRPEAPEFVDTTDPRWVIVLSVRPGIAGRSQLEFLDEAEALSAATPAEAYRTEILPRKLASDVAYVRNRTVRGDVRIVVQTVRLLLFRD